jgi:hypothetical protein
MKATKSIIVVLFVLLSTQIASAYYCPSTGRWLSRDPKGELGFTLLKDGWIKRSRSSSNQNCCPSCKRNANKNLIIGDANIYAFVNNDPLERIDYLGLTDWGSQVDAAWFAAQKALPGSEFNDAFQVFGACNSLGLALAWARTQYNDCIADALMGPPAQDSAAEKVCEKTWQPKIKLLSDTYDAECKCAKK